METQEKKKTVWDLIEGADERVSDTAGLYEWSLNFDAGKTPFTLFLDLIGWSAEHIGSPLFDLSEVHRTLGFMECDYLGDALKEYANNPQRVGDFVDELIAAEMGE